jgi:hypothetical protein
MFDLSCLYELQLVYATSGTNIEALFIVDGQGKDDKYADSSAIGYPYWKPIR